MAVTGQRAYIYHFASYMMHFQKIMVYNISAVGEDVRLAYCDLTSFELSL